MAETLSRPEHRELFATLQAFARMPRQPAGDTGPVLVARHALAGWRTGAEPTRRGAE